MSEDAHDLPPGVELAAYRIVQEALTNARKHSRAHHATVRLDVASGVLEVVVTDDGVVSSNGSHRGSSTKMNRHGLVGMRERVAVYGGSLHAGPADGGGYRVTATLPFDEEGA